MPTIEVFAKCCGCCWQVNRGNGHKDQLGPREVGHARCGVYMGVFGILSVATPQHDLVSHCSCARSECLTKRSTTSNANDGSWRGHASSVTGM